MKVEKILSMAALVLICLLPSILFISTASAQSCRDSDTDSVCDCIFDPSDPVYPNCEDKSCEPDIMSSWRGACDYMGKDKMSCDGLGFCRWNGEICEVSWSSLDCWQYSGNEKACTDAPYCECVGDECQCEDDKDAACAVFDVDVCGVVDACTWNGTACVYVGDEEIASCSSRDADDCLVNDYCRIKEGCSPNFKYASERCNKLLSSATCEEVEYCNWNGVCAPDYDKVVQCGKISDIDACTDKNYCMWSGDCFRCTERPDNCPDVYNAEQSDSDGDGVGDLCDNCLSNPNPSQKDSDRIVCPEGIPGTLSDGYGDACDNCPSVYNPEQSDSDDDGIGDRCDMVDIILEPANPSPTDIITITVIYRETEPAPEIKIFVNAQLVKSCNERTCSFTGGPYRDGFMYEVEYTVELVVYSTPPAMTYNFFYQDSDGDGIINFEDNCIFVENPDQKDSEIGQIGEDCITEFNCIPVFGPNPDGIGDVCDNCPNVFNPWQLDPDGDLLGAACDNCPDDLNPNQENSDWDLLGDACDNCPNHNNELQTDTDNNGVGDACDSDDDGDLCPDAIDPYPLIYSNDFDLDGKGDDCDNCPGLFTNPGQEDLDGDGEGDACDCDDVNQGDFEDGIDCGGWACPACIECTWCNEFVEPVLIKGHPNSGKIDVVFVPHENYSGFMNDFNDQVIITIREAVFTMDQLSVDPIPADYKDRFNFYRYIGGFASSGDCAPVLPYLFPFAVPYYDSAGVLSRNPIGGCASPLGPPSRWIATGGDIDVSIHEMMHSIFGLTDEYCGDTSYTMMMIFANVFYSQEACINNAAAAGWTLGNCRRICTSPIVPGSPIYWTEKWRYDPDSPHEDVMTCQCTSYRFYEADLRRINYVFNSWPSSNTLGVLINFNFSGDTISLLSADVVEGHPDLGMQYPHFMGEPLSSMGEVVESFGIGDPRIELGEKAVYRDNVNFHVIIPFHDNLRKFRIKDNETGDPLITVDLTETLNEFCTERDYEGRECQSILDPDGDGIEGMNDNCPFVFNPSQEDTDEDGLGDVCDNCPDHYNPDQVDLDGDNHGDICDNCPLDYNPYQTDTDNDGAGDLCDPDDDNDGLSDYFEEERAFTDPFLWDSDKNGIGDGEEDPDDDGFSNLEEYNLDTDPLDGCSKVIFVDVTALNGGAGTSWEDAFKTLPAAISVANPGNKIWAKEGIYHDPSFWLKDGVKVYGGFDSGLTERTGNVTGRDLKNHISIMDGQNQSKNINLGNNSSIDGFTFQNFSVSSGGILYANFTTSSIANCILKNNTVIGSAALAFGNYGTISLHDIVVTNNSIIGFGNGSLVYATHSTINISECMFTNNSVLALGGGALYNTNGTASYINCIFENNSTIGYGGALYNISSSSTIINCVFRKNSAAMDGGAIYNNLGNLTIINSTFVDNSSSNSGGAIWNNSDSLTLTNSVLWGNSALFAGDTLHHTGLNPPEITYCDMEDGWDGEGNIDTYPFFLDMANGDLRLQYNSPCIDAANGDAAPQEDITGNPRSDVPATPNTGTGEPNYVDIGAYEYTKIFHDLDLPIGWSMISLPVLPDHDDSVSYLFPDAVVVYGYKKGVGYEQMTAGKSLRHGKGYWIFFNGAQEHTLTGQCIPSYTLPVSEEGWDMVGGCSHPAQVSSDGCSIGVIYRYVKGLGYQRVTKSENLTPGKGYWVLINDVTDNAALNVK